MSYYDAPSPFSILSQQAVHPRSWRQNLYVYPVISRRSRGLSIGVNLNPDAACNFDCIYCQVDRTAPVSVRSVDLSVLEQELNQLVSLGVSGVLFDEPEFSDVPQPFRRLQDIAFSGDGEPTTCTHFKEAVLLATQVRSALAPADVKIILITDACYLRRSAVVEALELLDKNNGEIWAKLDAGTELYYQEVNRPNYPLKHVIDCITAAARIRPIVIQSMFLRMHGQGPAKSEITAYIGQLREILDSGGRIKLVQVYTIARKPPVPFVTPLDVVQVDEITRRVCDETGLAAESYYGAA